MKTSAQRDEPRQLWVCYPAVDAVDGVSVTDYLRRRYGEGAFGFVKDDRRCVFFFDEGHRDEFHARYGGLTGVAHRNNPVGFDMVGAR